MDKYKEDKVVFIIDECHRTQFGEMHRLIRQHFLNAQYFGFTGTPRFEDSSQDGRATADIFENVYTPTSSKMRFVTATYLVSQWNISVHLRRIYTRWTTHMSLISMKMNYGWLTTVLN